MKRVRYIATDTGDSWLPEPVPTYSVKPTQYQEPVVVGIIPARLGSKGVPDKNIRLLGGKALMSWTIEAAVASKLSNVFVTTESEKVAQIARAGGATVIMRPPAYSMDDVQLDDVYVHAYREIAYHGLANPDYLMFLVPTTPFRTTTHINNALSLASRGGTVVSCHVDRRFHWQEAGGQIIPVNHNPEKRLGRQWEKFMLVENGAIYIVPTGLFAAYRTQRIPPFYPFVMDEISGLDIDEMIDWELAELLEKKYRAV